MIFIRIFIKKPYNFIHIS